MKGRLTDLLLLCAMGKSIGKPWCKELGGQWRGPTPSLKESTIGAESPRPRSEVLRCPLWLSDNLQCRKHRFNPWARKISWRRKWQPTPVFLPGKCHGERSLVDYSPWGHRVRHDWARTHLYALYPHTVCGKWNSASLWSSLAAFIGSSSLTGKRGRTKLVKGRVWV